MSHYHDYSAKDFALDENFQKWVLNPDEQTTLFWNNLLLKYPHKGNTIEEAIQLVQLSGLSPDPEANVAYLEVWNNVRSTAEKDRTVVTRKFSRYASMAAAVAGILIASFYILQQGNDNPLEYKTAYGEIKEVVLEDGSKVTLNANSSLKLSDSWMGENDREVFLQGEAFFNVVKMSDHKSFKVKTSDGIMVEVLGTTFNVNTRRENLTVYLQSGKVNLRSDADVIALLPGQQANYNKALQKVIVSIEDLEETEDKLAWKSNLYIINDLPLSMVARDIEDNFGRQVILLDSTLSSYRVTAKVPAGDISILLKVLAEALEIEIEQKNNQVIINPRR